MKNRPALIAMLALAGAVILGLGGFFGGSYYAANVELNRQVAQANSVRQSLGGGLPTPFGGPVVAAKPVLPPMRDPTFDDVSQAAGQLRTLALTPGIPGAASVTAPLWIATALGAILGAVLGALTAVRLARPRS